MIEDYVKDMISFLSFLIEGAAAVIITLGAIEALFKTFKLVFTRNKIANTLMQPEIRIGLGRWLALGLEFELAGDILRTAVTPSWNDIGKLAAIIILRTTLNYFLEKDIQQYEAKPATATE